MERMVHGTGKNSPEEYDRIYFERAKRPPDDQDVRRWRRLIKYFKCDGNKLIDLGTLDSLIPVIAKKRCPKAEVWGIDIAEKAIEDMSKRHPEIIYEVRDLYDTKFPNESFDYAVLGEVIEHLEYPDRAVKEAMRILKKGGMLALSTPLNEAIEPGAVDKERHLFSFEIDDIIKLLQPYGEVKTVTLGSEYFPRYRYCWPTILAWCRKKHA